MKHTATAAVLLAWLLSTLAGCKPPVEVDWDQVAEGHWLGEISTDKAVYHPGEKVRFALQFQERLEPMKLLVRYKHLQKIVQEQSINASGDGVTWEWETPPDDFRGYLVEVLLQQADRMIDHTNIAVDVSSHWRKFPRYGYLADFPEMSEAKQQAVIERLNRFHINGVQFYDWQYKHHWPVKWQDDGRTPADLWLDIANRPVSFETVRRYIDLAHSRNMKTMNYNLLFGAYEDAEQDGVDVRNWGLYNEAALQTIDKHPLPDSWASDILLMDPGNSDWQQYLFEQEKKVFEVLPFDGWHIDQLGYRGVKWNHKGEKVLLDSTYAPFLTRAKANLDVEYVMNAVSQFGQPAIAESPVSFLYTEVWNERPYYQDLKQVIEDNWQFSDRRLNTVLAAYVNYNHSNSPGSFNTPGVLLANAVIFASGGAHLELGENMLSKEYFPVKNLTIPEQLHQSLVHYYDFLVAYQNVLRDGVTPIRLDPESIRGDGLSLKAERGRIWTFARQRDGQDILHFINFTDSAHLMWSDTDATQTEPAARGPVRIEFQSDREISSIWTASPDYHHGSAIALDFRQENGSVHFQLPNLKYWGMVVIEY